MKRTHFKRVSMPSYTSVDEGLRILEAHINDLENSLEVLLDAINEKIDKEDEADVS